MSWVSSITGVKIRKEVPVRRSQRKCTCPRCLPCTTFSKLRWQNHEASSFMTFCQHSLVGLSQLHRRGIMHRDVSRKNMLIVSLDPPCAAICDFGKATEQSTSTYKYLGPTATVAPEVHNSTGPYTAKIDIWSWAYAISEVLCYRYREGCLIDSRRHESILEALRIHTIAFPLFRRFADLLESMLSWDPHDRPSSEQALQHDCWTLPPLPSSSLAAPTQGSKLILLTDPVITVPRTDRKRKATQPSFVSSRVPAQPAEMKQGPAPAEDQNVSSLQGMSLDDPGDQGTTGNDPEATTEGSTSNRTLSSLEIEARKRRDTAAVRQKLDVFNKGPHDGGGRGGGGGGKLLARK